LAWACATQLATTVKAFTLFATHYFEITELPEVHSNVANVHLDATEHNDNIVFLHNIQEGAASKSYGLQVAKLAGIPSSVIALAQQQLHLLENQHLSEAQPATQAISVKPKPKTEALNSPLQNDLFGSSAPHPAVDALEDIDPDELTPRQALEQLYQLKKLLKD
jgi:DNA mismatch repair protein MutS